MLYGTFELLNPHLLCLHTGVHQLRDVVDEYARTDKVVLLHLLVPEDRHAGGQDVVLNGEHPHAQVSVNMPTIFLMIFPFLRICPGITIDLIFSCFSMSQTWTP